MKAGSSLVDLGGTGPEIFSIPCSFSENLAISYVGAPPGWLAPPPTGNPGSAPGLSGSSIGHNVLLKIYTLSNFNQSVFFHS